MNKTVNREDIESTTIREGGYWLIRLLHRPTSITVEGTTKRSGGRLYEKLMTDIEEKININTKE